MDVKRNLSLFAGLIAIAAGACLWGGARVGFADTIAQPTTSVDPSWDTRPTLDPSLFHGQVREAYEIAQESPGLLSQLHCYCGCDKSEGHKSLLDCYRDRHGSHCAMCVGEALTASQLAKLGTPVEQIREVLRSRYGHGS